MIYTTLCPYCGSLVYFNGFDYPRHCPERNFKIQVGTYQTRAEAEAMAKVLNKNGFPTTIINNGEK